MSRRPNLIPSIYLNLALPLDVHSKLSAHLFSPLEGRVPLGRYSSFITERVREALDGGFLDLAPWGKAPPGAFILHGTPEAIEHLKTLLSEHTS